jgi:mannose-1-phosphate guanylyltransferase / mannose-6-phosphate isomerase
MKVFILCGGEGTRLWPLSKKELPKQFLNLGDEKTLLQRTVQRMQKVCATEDIYILSNTFYLDILTIQLPDFSETQFILEPESRNTLPALLFGIDYLKQHNSLDSDEVIVMCPSDHKIAPDEKFISQVLLGKEVVEKEKLVVFGINPTKAETGYGYILKEADEKVGAGFKVKQFIEKPSLKLAEKYISSGDYFWNSGILMFNEKLLLKEVDQSFPEGALFFNKEVSFDLLSNVSIDCGILEKSSNIAVLPLELSWSDIGSFDQLHEELIGDKKKNITVGNVIEVDTESTLVLGGRRLIATIGLKDLIIADSNEAILIAKKGESQKVKKVVSKIKKLNLLDWGWIDSIDTQIVKWHIYSNHNVPRETLPQGLLWVVLEGAVYVDGKQYRSGNSFHISDNEIENREKATSIVVSLKIGYNAKSMFV